MNKHMNISNPISMESFRFDINYLLVPLESHYRKHKTIRLISSSGIKVRISQQHTEIQVICFKTTNTELGAINHTDETL